MKVSYVTSFRDGRTKIAFQEGSKLKEQMEVEAPELRALYEFYGAMAKRCPGHNITFISERSNATDVWELDRIKGYRVDGFRNKPAHHAGVLKALDDYTTANGIEFKFKRITLKKKNELAALVNPKAVRQPLPNLRKLPEEGDGFPQRHESARELTLRAILRDRR